MGISPPRSGRIPLLIILSASLICTAESAQDTMNCPICKQPKPVGKQGFGHLKTANEWKSIIENYFDGTRLCTPFFIRTGNRATEKYVRGDKHVKICKECFTTKISTPSHEFESFEDQQLFSLNRDRAQANYDKGKQDKDIGKVIEAIRDVNPLDMITVFDMVKLVPDVLELAA